jgi:hypothetical protein
MSAHAMSGDGRRDVKRTALLLALVALAFYLGFILWIYLHGAG